MKIWTPEDPNERLYVCRVLIDGEGTMCRRTFLDEQAWQKHVGRCAREHIDEIRAGSLKARMPIFDSWNPELDEYLAKVGKRMLAEGRLEMKPNERVHNE